MIMNRSRTTRLNSSALASLRFFEAVARLMNFTRAGAELSVTPGAVSHQIKYLEDSLGFKLFYRLPKQIRLTEEGQKFAELVARTLKELDEGAASVVRAYHSTLEVRLRAGPSFALRWLVPRLGGLCKRHPNIKLRVIGDYGYFDPVHRDFDIAVEFIQGPVAALHSEVLLEEYLVPVCSPEYLAKQRPLKAFAELKRCILLHDGDAWESAAEDAEWRLWLKEVGAYEVDSSQGQFFTLANMAIEAALTGQGIAMGRVSLVEDLLRARRLVAPFPQRVKSPTRYCLVYPDELANSPGVKAVAEWLRQEARMTTDTAAERELQRRASVARH